MVTLFIVEICIILSHILCAAFIVLPTSLPVSPSGAAAAAIKESHGNTTSAKLILLTGFYVDSVHSIDLQSLLDTFGDHNDSWLNTNTYFTMNVPSNAYNITHHTGTWTQYNDTIYGVPIYSDASSNQREFNHLFKFDLISKQYTNQNQYTFLVPTAALFPCIIASSSFHKLYIMGGNNGTLQSKTLQIYDIVNDEWNKDDNKLTIGSSAAGCSITSQQDIIYYFGGEIDGINHVQTNVIQKYDIISDEWNKLNDTALKVARYAMSCVYLHSIDYIYCIGGSDDDQNVLSSIEMFDVQMEEVLESNIYLNTGRMDPVVVLYKEHIIVLGGYNDSNDYFRSIEVLDVQTTDITPTMFPTPDPTAFTFYHFPTVFPSIVATVSKIEIMPTTATSITISSTLLFIIIVIGAIDVILFCVCLFYIFQQLLGHIQQPGNIYWSEALKRLYWTDYTEIVFETMDITTDYIFSANLILNSKGNDESEMLGWISLIVAVFGLTLFYLKWMLKKKLCAYQIYNLVQKLNSNHCTQKQRINIVTEIRLRKMDVEILNLMIGCTEDVPQCCIVVIILANGEFNYISIFTITMSLLSFFMKLLHVIMSKLGCQDFDDEMDAYHVEVMVQKTEDAVGEDAPKTTSNNPEP